MMKCKGYLDGSDPESNIYVLVNIWLITNNFNPFYNLIVKIKV